MTVRSVASRYHSRGIQKVVEIVVFALQTCIQMKYGRQMPSDESSSGSDAMNKVVMWHTLIECQRRAYLFNLLQSQM
jgi:hypothetical protein